MASKKLTFTSIITQVREVFLAPRGTRELAVTSHELARRENPLVTLDLNLTFMQTPAVKRVKLMITKGTKGNLAITRPLGITNQTNQSY